MNKAERVWKTCEKGIWKHKKLMLDSLISFNYQPRENEALQRFFSLCPLAGRTTAEVHLAT